MTFHTTAELLWKQLKCFGGDCDLHAEGPITSRRTQVRSLHSPLPTQPVTNCGCGSKKGMCSCNSPHKILRSISPNRAFMDPDFVTFTSRSGTPAPSALSIQKKFALGHFSVLTTTDDAPPDPQDPPTRKDDQGKEWKWTEQWGWIPIDWPEHVHVPPPTMDWPPPPPPCCCCPMKLFIEEKGTFERPPEGDEKRWNKDIEKLPKTWVGDWFTARYVVDFHHIKEDEEPGDCTAEMWELNSPDKQPVDTAKKRKGVRNDTTIEWDKHKQACPGSVSGRFYDAPGPYDLEGGDKNPIQHFRNTLRIMIVIRKAPKCDCKPPWVALKITQRVNIAKGVRNTAREMEGLQAGHDEDENDKGWKNLQQGKVWDAK